MTNSDVTLIKQGKKPKHVPRNVSITEDDKEWQPAKKSCGRPRKNKNIEQNPSTPKKPK